MSLRNPKVLGPARSVGSSFFYSTGLETRHDNAVKTASEFPVLPQTTDQLPAKLEQGGLPDERNWEGEDLGRRNAKRDDDDEDDDDDDDDDE